MRATDEQIRWTLEQYGLGEASYRVLQDLENTVLKATLEDRQFGVHICAQDVEREQLEVNLDWLEALARDTALIVPQPFRNTSGERITTLEDRWAVVFRWVEGEPVSKHMNLEAAHAIGRLTATLHNHAQSYTPLHTTSSSFDLAWLNGPESWWVTRARRNIPEDFARLERCIAFAESVMKQLGTGHDQYGLIHNDLHFGNILVHDGSYRVIDFNQVQSGHYLFDLGVTEAEFLDYADGPALIQTFRSGYEHARGVQLDPRDLAAFRIAGGVAFLEWVFTSPNQSVQETKLGWVQNVIDSMLQEGEFA